MAKTLEDDFTEIKGVIRLVSGGKPFTAIQDEEMRTLFFAGVRAVMNRLQGVARASQAPNMTKETLDIKKIVFTVFEELQVIENECTEEFKNTIIKMLDQLLKPK